MNKTITVDFYKVAIPADSGDLPAIFNTIVESPNPVLEFGGDFFLLQSVGRSGQIWHGDITRVRTELPVTRGSATGKTEVIPCGANEGPYEQAAFLYSPPTQTLIIQRNRAGAATRGFALCVKHYGQFEDAVELEPLIEQTVWDRVARMEYVKRFEIKVAGLESPKVFQDQAYGVNAIGDFMEKMSAPTIQIVASIGRGRGHRALNGKTVKEAARRLLKLSNKEAPEITKIEIGGKDEEEHSDLVDLIKGRISEKISISRATDKTLPLSERMNALHAAWQKRRDEIALLYQRDGP
jgi:hypothetical protein